MPTMQLTKDDWVQKYAQRILQMWQNWQGPLGKVDEKYIRQIETELQDQFDDPLKRAMIEATY